MIVYILIILLVCLNLNAFAIGTWDTSKNNTNSGDLDNIEVDQQQNANLENDFKDYTLNSPASGINTNFREIQSKELDVIQNNIKNSNLGYLFEDKESITPANVINEQLLAKSAFKESNIKVNNDYGTDNQYEPSIAIGPKTGNVYIVWIDNRVVTNKFVYFARSIDHGHTFDIFRIVNEGGNAGAPQILADKNEALHVVWHDDRDINFDIWYSRSDDMGIFWENNVCVNEYTKDHNQTNPVMALNNSVNPPTIWVAWQDPQFTNGTHDGIVLTYSVTGGNEFFDSPYEIYTNNQNNNNATNPDMAVDDLGYIWIVWNEEQATGEDQDIYFTRTATAPDPGVVKPIFSFNKRVDDGPANTNQTKPVIAVYNHTIAYVAWQDDRSNLSTDIYFAKYVPSSNSFDTDLRINKDNSELTNQISPAMIVNATTGHIYITWLDGRNGYFENYLAKSTNKGASFGNNILLDDDFINNRINKKIYPSSQKNIAIGPKGDVHVAYSEDRFGNQDIFYQQSTDYGATWSKSIMCNENSSEGIQKNNFQYQIAIDDNNIIYIVWEDHGAKNLSYSPDIYFAKSTNYGLTFSPSVRVNYEREGVQKNPSIAVNDSWIFVSWTKSPDIALPGDIYFSYSYDGGQTFDYNQFIQENELVNGISKDNDNSQIVLNSSGDVFITYQGYNEEPPNPPSLDIFLANSFYNSTLNEFNPFNQRVVNNDAEIFPVEQQNPSIAIDYVDNMYIVFEDDRNDSKSGSDIYIAKSNTSEIIFLDNYLVNDLIGDIHNTSTEHKYPSVAVNPIGELAVTWQDDRLGSNNIYFANSTDGGVTFGINKLVNTNQVNDKQMPTITIGFNNNVFITWQDSRNGDWDIYVTNTSDFGNTFAQERKVTDDTTGADQTNPSIAMNTTDSIYIVWTDTRGYNTDVNNKKDYYIARSNNYGQSFEKNYCVHSYQGDPALAVDANGMVYAVWSDNRFGYWDIFFARSTVGGQFFNANFRININRTNSRGNPDIAVINNKIFVVWEDARMGENNKTITFCKSMDGGKTFSGYIDISRQLGNQINPSIAVDKYGVAHVVWQDVLDPNQQILYYTNSTNWANRKNISPTINPLILFKPCIAINDATNPIKIFIVFENRTVSNNWDIYFTRSTNGGNSFMMSMLVNDGGGLPARQSDPAIDADSKGNVAIVWQDFRAGHWDIYGDFSSDNGLTFGVSDVFINGTVFNERLPDVAIDRINGSNSVVVFQSDNGTQPNTNFNIFVAVTFNNGSLISGGIRIDDTTTEVQNQIKPRIATDGKGSYYAVWEDYRHGNADIYLNMTDETMPIAEAGPDIYIDQSEAAQFLAETSWDNVGLAKYTWTFNDGGMINLYGYANKHIFNLPGNYLVTLTVEDYNGNKAQDTLMVYVRDMTPPSFDKDNTGLIAYTGNTFTFDVEVYDYKIYQVKVEYWYGKTNATTYTSPMSLIGLSWVYTISQVEDTYLDLYYEFSANDSNDNWNYFLGGPIDVLDDDLPEIGTDSSDTEATTGDAFQFSITATDNINVETGYVTYKYGSAGTPNNQQMSKSGNTFTYQISSIPDQLTTLYYFFEFQDNSTIPGGPNERSTTEKSVVIKDNDKPTFVEDNTDTIALTNKTFKFSLKFDDNINTDTAMAYYYYGTNSASKQSLTLNKNGDYYENSIKIQNSLEILNYNFTFWDTSNNWDSTTVTQVTVTDDTNPMSIKGSGNIGTTTGEPFELFAKFSDNVNIDLVKIYYSKEGAAWQNKEITSGTNGYYRVTNEDLEIDTTNDLTTWRYYFYAEDTSANYANYGTQNEPYIITVTDNDKPVADAGDDIEVEEGDTVYFDGSGSTDNIGITKYTWTFTYDEKVKELSGVKPTGGFTFDIGGQYDVTLKVGDAEGNTDTDTILVTVGVIAKPKVILLTPNNFANTSDSFMKLKWKTTYPNPELITYDLYFGEDSSPSLKEPDLRVTEYEVDNLKDKTTYYWTVQPKFGTIKGDKAPVRQFYVDFGTKVYGIDLESDEDKLVITVGTSKSLTLTVKNTGTTMDTVTLSVDKGNYPDSVLLEKDEINIMANEEFDVKLTVKSKETTPIDNYTITVSAKSTGDPTKEKSVDIDIQTVSEPTDGDKDNDNLPDWWEIKYFGNIEAYDGDDDPDNDGKTNYQEYLDDTHPLKDERKKEEEDKANNTMVIVGAVAVIIIIVILLLLFMLMKKKGKKPAPEKPEQVVPPKGVGGTPVMPRKPSVPPKPAQTPTPPPRPPMGPGAQPQPIKPAVGPTPKHGAPRPGPTPTPAPAPMPGPAPTQLPSQQPKPPVKPGM